MPDIDNSETASGLCAGCGRKYDVLYRKGRLYYCKECLKSVKIEEPKRAPKPKGEGDFKKDTGTSFVKKGYRGQKDRFKKNSSELNSKFIRVFFLILPICFLIPIYFAFSSQEVRIVDIWVDDAEIFSGDEINLYVTLNRYTQINLGKILDWLNDLFGYIDEIYLNLDGEVIAKREIYSEFNEEITYSFPILEKEPGIHKIRVGNFLEEFEVLKIARFEGSSLEISPINPWIADGMNVSMSIVNVGGFVDETEVHCFIKRMITEDLPGIRSETEIGKTKVSLDPNHSDIVSFYFDANVTGLYDVSFYWETGSLNATFFVDIPFDPLDRPEYYYSFARSYVQENYNIPENKSIDDLVNFLDKLEFPKYEVSVFDCSDASSLLEWLLEGAGFHAYVCTNSMHAWVQVETRDGIVAIESTQLTEGWGLEDYSSKPTGIVMKSDGTFKEFTYDYRLFLEWKKKYPPSRYKVDPNITFEEWDSNRYYIPKIGIPTKSEYYTASRNESPSDHLSTSEYDWWTVYPYSEIFPFSKWGGNH